MHLLTEKERILLLEKENRQLRRELKNRESDLLYISMMTGVSLEQSKEVNINGTENPSENTTQP